MGSAGGPLGSEVLALARAPGGALWVGTADGAVAVEGGRVTATPAELRGERIIAVAVGLDGTAWFATERKGLAQRAPGAGAMRFLTTRDGLPGGLRLLFVDQRGTTWVGGEGGLARLRGGRAELLQSPEGTVPLRAIAMAEDREGNAWCGFEAGGLRRLSDSDFINLGSAEGLPNEVATTVLEDARGDVWIGTFGGLAVAPGGDPARLRTVVKGRTAVLALVDDGRGGVVFGQSDGALGRVARGEVRWLAEPTPKRGVLSLLVEPGGGLLLGTVAGLFRLEAGRLALEPRTGLPDGVRINALARGADGALWAGLELRGAWRRPPGGRFEPVAGPPADHDVNDLLLEPDGSAWIATLGAGLWHVRGATARAITTAQGLADDTVWRVIADGERRLWLSSNKGLSSIAREELLALVEGRVGQVTPSTFGAAEGMRSRECNGGIQPAGWRSADGRLWFPTVKGVAVVDPARLRAPAVPPAYLDRLVVDGMEQPATGAVRLEPGTRRLQVGFGAPAFASPGRVAFRFRLAGFDPGWVDARDERVATYTDLPPGRFRFELQARIGGGPWGEPAALEIERRPGLVERRWFWPGLVMLAATLGLAGFGLRLRRLRANEVELQRRVDQAIGDLKRLEGMLPVCAWCKTARRDPAYWTRIETWLQEHDRADVTHALCPDCQARYFPGGGRDGT
jgi:ligand-binding sensor domain-containing protein